MIARARSLESYTQDLFTYPDEDSKLVREARTLATAMSKMIRSAWLDPHVLSAIIDRLRYVYDLVLTERKQALSREIVLMRVMNSAEMKELKDYLGTLENVATQEELNQDYQKCLDAALEDKYHG